MSQALTLESICDLYRKFGADLKRVRECQREFYISRARPDWLERNVVWRSARTVARNLHLPVKSLLSLRPQLDDVEAEIVYLLVRELRPRNIVEISPSGGWSTSWLLHALRDNDDGQLYSFDMIDDATRILPADLTQGRWEFTCGDIRRNVNRLPDHIDFLFMDSDHGEEFGRWYVGTMFPRLPAGALVSVHDVFHSSDPCSHDKEGGVVVEWLDQGGRQFFTASPAKEPEHFAAISRLRQQLGFGDSIHDSQSNSMIFFLL